MEIAGLEWRIFRGCLTLRSVARYMKSIGNILQATVSEVQRLSSIAPLAIAHRTKTSVEVEGFSFPPSSTFFSNLHFIMRDPSNFPDPEAFNPLRFIGEDGRCRN